MAHSRRDFIGRVGAVLGAPFLLSHTETDRPQGKCSKSPKGYNASENIVDFGKGPLRADSSPLYWKIKSKVRGRAILETSDSPDFVEVEMIGSISYKPNKVHGEQIDPKHCKRYVRVMCKGDSPDIWIDMSLSLEEMGKKQGIRDAKLILNKSGR